MENVFVKFYVLISLWFWAGMLLSKPLRKAFGEMHRRILNRIREATWGQVIKIIEKATVLLDRQKQKLSLRVARSLISKELLEELTHKNLVAAIGRARQIEQSSYGIMYDDLLKITRLLAGKFLEDEVKKVAVAKSFEICNTTLFENIMLKVPRAQERILLALDQLEGRSPYSSILNQEYRKFIRE